MKWYYRIERKLWFLQFPHLMAGITACMLMVYIAQAVQYQANIFDYIALYWDAVLGGEVWRLVTFLFVPPSTNLFFLAFSLYLLIFLGNTLSEQWGLACFNLFYILGILGAVAAAFISGEGNNYYLNLSLTLAFAQMFPDYEFMLFFLLPVKVKYFAYVAWGLYALTLLVAPWPLKVSALLSLLHYFLFFGPDIWRGIKDWRKYRKQRKNFRRFY